MDRVSFTQYQGKKILIEDFSGLRPGPEFMDTIKTAQTVISSQPQKSVLALLDASNVNYNAEVLGAMKDFVQANTPYVKCAAVVGVSGLLNVALTTLSKAANRPLHTFATRQEALDFLVTQ
ncbi:MAG: hypothetical protein LWX83_05725 [Anaerolineae bacterium]|nr:hypothetical protein [Anaerolineae bacterium]